MSICNGWRITPEKDHFLITIVQILLWTSYHLLLLCLNYGLLIKFSSKMDICVELHEHIAWGYEHINKNKFVLEKCARTLPFYTLKFYTFTPYTLTSYNFKTQKCAKTQIQFKT